MKTIIGILLIYFIVIIMSTIVVRFIWSPFDGTSGEMSVKECLKTFSIGYMILGLFILFLYLIDKYLF